MSETNYIPSPGGTVGLADRTVGLNNSDDFPDARRLFSVVLTNNTGVDLWLAVLQGTGVPADNATITAGHDGDTEDIIDIQKVASGSTPGYIDYGIKGIPTPKGFTVLILSGLDNGAITKADLTVYGDGSSNAFVNYSWL